MNRKNILASLQSLLELRSVILQLMPFPCEGEDYESFSRFFCISISYTLSLYEYSL